VSVREGPRREGPRRVGTRCQARVRR
jgi:hypothetical protein